jgi:hypothetical protein
LEKAVCDLESCYFLHFPLKIRGRQLHEHLFPFLLSFNGKGSVLMGGAQNLLLFLLKTENKTGFMSYLQHGASFLFPSNFNGKEKRNREAFML